MDISNIANLLERIATALEKQQPNLSYAAQAPDWKSAHAFIWQAQNLCLKPVPDTGALPHDLLIGIDQNYQILLQNTLQFASGFSANNALLWGARGTGKSSSVKSIHHKIINEGSSLYLIEIYREDLSTLPILLDLLKAETDKRFILFCDDLSFDAQDNGYKALKSVLEGGIEERPSNVLFYATSNRRHLVPRDMIENERHTAIHPGEAVDEKVSLSDRFGLWLGYHPCDQEHYLQMIDAYAKHFNLSLDQKALHQRALEWATTRGARSGRVAWQFIQDLKGKSQS